MPQNVLYYGDNLDIMREHIADESVDLVYLDPPFNSARDYNVLFKQARKDENQAQIMAFTDTWQWSKKTYDDFFGKMGTGKWGKMGTVTYFFSRPPRKAPPLSCIMQTV